MSPDLHVSLEQGMIEVSESECDFEDHGRPVGSILGLGKSLGEGKGYSLQYSGLKNSVDCIVHGVTQSWT